MLARGVISHRVSCFADLVLKVVEHVGPQRTPSFASFRAPAGVAVHCHALTGSRRASVDVCLLIFRPHGSQVCSVTSQASVMGAPSLPRDVHYVLHTSSLCRAAYRVATPLNVVRNNMTGRPFVASLEGNVYCCSICTAHLALQGDLLSKVRLAVC